MAKTTLPTINTNNVDQMLLGALIEAQSAIKEEIKSMNENLFHGLEDESGKKLDTQTSLIAGGTKTKNLDSVSDNTKKTADMASLNVDIAKTGEDSYYFVGLWESKEALVNARPKMIAHLDEVRGFMKKLSPELGVTDPVSGDIVAYGAEHL